MPFKRLSKRLAQLEDQIVEQIDTLSVYAGPILHPPYGQQPKYGQPSYYVQQPPYGQPSYYGQQPQYRQQPQHVRLPQFSQQPQYGPQPQYEQQPQYGQQAQYGQQTQNIQQSQYFQHPQTPEHPQRPQQHTFSPPNYHAYPGNPVIAPVQSRPHNTLTQSNTVPDTSHGNDLCSICRQQDWEYHFNRYWDGRAHQDDRAVANDLKPEIIPGTNNPAEPRRAIKASRERWPGEFELAIGRTTFRLQPYRFMVLNRHFCSVCKLIVEAVESPQWPKDPNFIKRDGSSNEPVTIEIQMPQLSPNGFYSTPQMLASIHELYTSPINFQNIPKTLSFTKVAYPDPHQADVTAIMGWWANCKQHHGGTCGPYYEARAGLQELGKLRVIDVIKKKVVSVSCDVDYIALSYCWGTAKVYTAAQSDFVNDELLLHDKQLPRTIEDAITLTELIGERYLWVDSVCIVQDHVQDVRHYVSQMHNIYKAARFTIVNASAASADVGLEGLRPNSRSLKFAQSNIAGTSMIELPNRIDITKSPWAQRAWTFQENYFATNRVIFAAGRVFYTCASATCSEHFQSQLNQEQIKNSFLSPIVLNLSGLDSQSGAFEVFEGIPFHIATPSGDSDGGNWLSTYLQNVTLYGKRRATYQSDSLKAFTGVLSHLSTTSQSTSKFCWGLPTESFHIALGWTAWAYLMPNFTNRVTQGHLDTFRVERCRWNVRPEEGNATKQRTWFPSWSWASCDYFFTYNDIKGVQSCIKFPWEEGYFLDDAPNPHETGILRLYAEYATLHARDVKRQLLCAGIYHDTEVVLDDLSFFEHGEMVFMLTSIMALGSDDPTTQILGLVQVGMENGVRRYRRCCCLKIPRSFWEGLAVKSEVIDLV